MFKFLSLQTARVIDIMLSSVVFLGFLTNLLGLIKIDWTITYQVFHNLFAFTCVSLLITFGFTLIIMYLRKMNTIHTVWNLSIKYLIYFFGVINWVCLIIVIVCFVNITIDLATPTEPIDDGSRFDKFVNTQWNYIYYFMCINILLYSLQFPLWYSTFRRNSLKTDGILEDEDFELITNDE